MRNCQFFLLFFLLACAHSININWPAATSVAVDHWDVNGWSPQPTKAPMRLDDHQALRLERRQSASSATPSVNGSVCGYVGANADWPIYCEAPAICYLNTTEQYWFCCDPDSSGSFSSCSDYSPPSSCWDSTNAPWCTGTCTSGPATGRVCTDSVSQFCQLNLLITFLSTEVDQTSTNIWSYGEINLACGTAPMEYDLWQVATYTSAGNYSSTDIYSGFSSSYINPSSLVLSLASSSSEASVLSASSASVVSASSASAASASSASSASAASASSASSASAASASSASSAAAAAASASSAAAASASSEAAAAAASSSDAAMSPLMAGMSSTEVTTPITSNPGASTTSITIPASTSNTATDSAATSSPTTILQKAESHTGAIVGGVVGGVVFLALCAGIFFFRNVQKKRQKRKAAAGPSEIEQDDFSPQIPSSHSMTQVTGNMASYGGSGR